MRDLRADNGRRLPEDHEGVSTEGPDGPPTACGPKGELLRVKPNGDLVPGVESVQSYLHVHG